MIAFQFGAIKILLKNLSFWNGQIILTIKLINSFSNKFQYIFKHTNCLSSEAVACRCSVKKVFLEILQNSQGKTCAESFFKKVAASGLQLYYKRDSGTSVSFEFCKISKNAFSYKTPPEAVPVSSQDLKNALNNIPKEFLVVPIDKAARNIPFVCKGFYASVYAKELGSNNNSSEYTCSKTNNLTAVDLINKSIRGLKTKFGINDIPIKNYRSPNVYWVSKMYKNPIQAIFTIPSTKTSIKPLARTKTQIFLFFRQEKGDNDKCRLFKVANTFCVVQHSKGRGKRVLHCRMLHATNKVGY